MNLEINKIREDFLKLFSLPSPPPSRFQYQPFDSVTSRIDHTCLKPDAMEKDIEQLCNEAKMYGFYSVCIAPSFLSLARELLLQTKIKLVTVVGFPWGYATPETKSFETLDAIDVGAHEIDMVMNIGKLKSKIFQDVFLDIQTVIERADQIPVKVIVETGMLSPQEKIEATLIAQMAGATYIKTSTGFGSSGATLDDVRLIKSIVGNYTGIKASGGIKNFETAKQMMQAGADRIGTSAGVEIAKEEKKKR